MARSKNPLARFFGVIILGQTYLNILYLLLTLPLGIIYFAFFSAGLALGIPLVFLLVGFLILALLAVGWWAVAYFERYLAIWLLRVDVPPMEKPGPRREGFFGSIADWFTNPVTWKSLIFILLKLPLGIFTFTVLLAFATTSLGLAIAPLIYWWAPVGISVSSTIGGSIDTLPEAVIACIFGILLGFISLHVFNYMAYGYALWAKFMLGNERPAPGVEKPELPLQPVEIAAGAGAIQAEPAVPPEPEAPPFYEPAAEEDIEITPPHGIPLSDVSGGESPAEGGSSAPDSLEEETGS